MTRVLVADDHPMIQSAIELLLRGSGYELVGRAATAEQALRDIDRHQPDLVLLDIRMPDRSGLDVLRQMRARGDKRRTILLTAAIDDFTLLEALALRVDGIALKSADPALLLDCMDAVRAGGRWMDPELEQRAHALKAHALQGGPSAPLAPREREIIALIRRGLKNRDIAAELGVTEGTVKVYLHTLYEKVGVANRTELAMRADDILAGHLLKD